MYQIDSDTLGGVKSFVKLCKKYIHTDKRKTTF